MEMDDPDQPCIVCHGRGFVLCDCYPEECLCGRGDEPCPACDGTGGHDAADWLEGT